MTNSKPDASILFSAPMAELLHAPVSAAAERLTEALVTTILDAEEAAGPRKRQRSASAMDNLQATAAALTRDLLFAAPRTASEGWCFRPEGSLYFTNTEATAPQYRALVKAWKTEGLMERLPGIRFGREWNGEQIGGQGKTVGRSPRLRATPKLLAIAVEHGIIPDNLPDHFQKSYDVTYPLVLRRTLDNPDGRGGKRTTKENVPFTRTPDTDKIVDEVRALNAFLDAQTYAPSTTIHLVAIFGEDPQRPGQLSWGGRLSSIGADNFQNWSKPERRSLKINDEPAVEIDLRASHLTIYLASRGIHVPEGHDPYTVPDVCRSIVKRLVTTFFGRGNMDLKRWPQDLAADYEDETGRTLTRDYVLQDTIERIVEAIPALVELRQSGLGWGELQRIEASILRATLARLMEAGIPALPIHDSITVAEGHVDTAARVLAEEFAKATGVKPMLTINRAEEKEVG